MSDEEDKTTTCGEGGDEGVKKAPRRRRRGKITDRSPTGDGLEDMAAFIEMKSREAAKK